MAPLVSRDSRTTRPARSRSARRPATPGSQSSPPRSMSCRHPGRSASGRRDRPRARGSCSPGVESGTATVPRWRGIPIPGGTCRCQNFDGQTIGSIESGTSMSSRSKYCLRRSADQPRARLTGSSRISKPRNCGAGVVRHRSHRRLFGRTNFSAVCVSENLATFTSTRPGRFAGRHDDRFGDLGNGPSERIDQSAPSGASDFCSDSNRVEIPGGIDSKEDDVVEASHLRRLVDGGACPAKVLHERVVGESDNRDARAGLHAQLVDQALRRRQLCRPLLGRGPKVQSESAFRRIKRQAPACALIDVIDETGTFTRNAPRNSTWSVSRSARPSDRCRL